MQKDVIRMFSRLGAFSLVSASFTLTSAHAATIFSDGFETGKLYDDATGYSTRVADIDTNVSRTGSNSLVFNNKEGVLYTLADTYQAGTYTVSYYANRQSSFGHNLSFLTYGITGGYSPQLGVAYLEEASLPVGTWTQVTFDATIAAGDATIGQNVQLLIEQSRLYGVGSYNLFIDDLSISFSPAIPEPSTYGLIGIGALGLAIAARRRKSKVA